jgi:biopolymer transport protein ExbD
MERQQIVITITPDGAVFLAAERMEPQRLATRLKELGGERRPIAILADKGAPFSRIVEVMDAADGHPFEIAN